MPTIPVQPAETIDLTNNRKNLDMSKNNKSKYFNDPFDRIFNDINERFSSSGWNSMFDRNSFTYDPYSTKGLWYNEKNTQNQWKVVSNENNQLVLELDVPGFSKSNLNLELKNGLLTATGQTPSRSLTVSTSLPVRSPKLKRAVCENGILTVIVEGQPDETQKIEIE